MDLNARPPWSNGALRRLGDALRAGTAPLEDAPSYADVVAWHDNLANEVDNRIEGGSWAVESKLWTTSRWRLTTGFHVSSRRKTQDTLVDKLRRQPSLQLNTVQDLAGVRMDADLLLDEQTALAGEIAQHFGADDSAIHDLRDGAHAGYRAVHVWLRLPAGRVEIQIRTALQHLWADAYESLADTCGRGIRYGEPIDQAAAPGFDPNQVRTAVQTMHNLSTALAITEHQWQEASDLPTPDERVLATRADVIAKVKAITAAVLTIEGNTGEVGG
nr:GTP pyrophosphokinase family protein [Mycolicibacter acidiphilus]